MSKMLYDRHTLSNGAEIPYIGLGIFQMNEETYVRSAVLKALEVGYRLFDTAAVYHNEEQVGKAFLESGIDRSELYISAKIWNGDQGYDETLHAFERTLKNLQQDYLDLYLIHWPLAGKYRDTWKAMERLYEEGVVRSIGVANFKQHHLSDLLIVANEKPVLDQVETHPLLPQNELRSYLKEQGISHAAWSPLAKGTLMQNEVIESIASKHREQVDQVILQWHLNRDTIIIPKSIATNRIRENAQLNYFQLDDEDMAKIAKLETGKLVGPDSDDLPYFLESIKREREFLEKKAKG